MEPPGPDCYQYLMPCGPSTHNDANNNNNSSNNHHHHHKSPPSANPNKVSAAERRKNRARKMHRPSTRTTPSGEAATPRGATDLASGGLGISSATSSSFLTKKQERMIRNRESAALSRKRKRDQVEALEMEVDQLREKNRQLKQRLSRYETVESLDGYKPLASAPVPRPPLMDMSLRWTTAGPAYQPQVVTNPIMGVMAQAVSGYYPNASMPYSRNPAPALNTLLPSPSSHQPPAEAPLLPPSFNVPSSYSLPSPSLAGPSQEFSLPSTPNTTTAPPITTGGTTSTTITGTTTTTTTTAATRSSEAATSTNSHGSSNQLGMESTSLPHHTSSSLSGLSIKTEPPTGSDDLFDVFPLIDSTADFYYGDYGGGGGGGVGNSTPIARGGGPRMEVESLVPIASTGSEAWEEVLPIPSNDGDEQEPLLPPFT